MFDLGFTEIIVIGVVALVVLGPERMPEVARAAGRFFAKAQSYISQVKGEFERESQLAEIKKIRDELSSSAAGLRQSVKTHCLHIIIDYLGKIIECVCSGRHPFVTIVVPCDSTL